MSGPLSCLHRSDHHRNALFRSQSLLQDYSRLQNHLHLRGTTCHSLSCQISSSKKLQSFKSADDYVWSRTANERIDTQSQREIGNRSQASVWTERDVCCDSYTGQLSNVLSTTQSFTGIQTQWKDGLGSNGPSLPNQEALFMSSDGEPMPQGEEGELWIRGPNVFLGYHNNPVATSNSLTSDGFFRTGDIGYEDKEGNMYITDRLKELIKYKGFQVAPAELEGVLMGNDIVEDCAVIGVWDGGRETEVPLACVVLKDGKTEGREEEIVKWLGERVAGHKQLRGGVKFVDAIPKSASGKILRRLLKDEVSKGQDAKIKPKL
jgi:acyl-CoA synthetase (AMP-forming)/AMP-acid ligase II